MIAGITAYPSEQPGREHMNIVQPILFQACFDPEATAIILPGHALSPMSYGRLASAIHNIGRNALKRGLKSGDRVSILTADQFFSLLLKLGLSQVGIVTSEAKPSQWTRFGVTAAIVDHKSAALDAPRTWSAGNDWLEGDGTPLSREEISAGGDHPCIIATTSGTTGEPKGVLRSHAALFTVQSQYLSNYGQEIATARSVYATFPLSTVIGFRSILYVLWRAGTVFLACLSPHIAAEKIFEHRIELLVTTPAMALRIASFYESVPSLRSPYRAVVLVGGMASTQLIAGIRARLSSKIITSYGSTEALSTAGASVDSLASTPGAVGILHPFSGVEIVDENGTLLPPGDEGIIRIRHEAVADGYLGDPEASALAFRDGCFYPGDLGRVTADNFLVLSGRSKDVLFVGGSKINPEKIEKILEDYPNIVRAGAFTEMSAHGVEEVWAVVTARAPIDSAHLAQYCSKLLSSTFMPARIVVTDNIPQNSMGRIDRTALPEIARNSKNSTTRP